MRLDGVHVRWRLSYFTDPGSYEHTPYCECVIDNDTDFCLAVLGSVRRFHPRKSLVFAMVDPRKRNEAHNFEAVEAMLLTPLPVSDTEHVLLLRERIARKLAAELGRELERCDS